MTAAERVLLSLGIGSMSAGLCAGVSLSAHLAHVWPGVAVAFGLGVVLTLIRYTTRRPR